MGRDGVDVAFIEKIYASCAATGVDPAACDILTTQLWKWIAGFYHVHDARVIKEKAVYLTTLGFFEDSHKGFRLTKTAIELAKKQNDIKTQKSLFNQAKQEAKL
jgi:hypothetical protein